MPSSPEPLSPVTSSRSQLLGSPAPPAGPDHPQPRPAPVSADAPRAPPSLAARPRRRRRRGPEPPGPPSSPVIRLVHRMTKCFCVPGPQRRNRGSEKGCVRPEATRLRGVASLPFLSHRRCGAGRRAGYGATQGTTARSRSRRAHSPMRVAARPLCRTERPVPQSGEHGNGDHREQLSVQPGGHRGGGERGSRLGAAYGRSHREGQDITVTGLGEPQRLGVSGREFLGPHHRAHFPALLLSSSKGHLLPGAPRGLSTMWLWSSGTRRWALPTQGDPSSQ